MDHSSEEIVSFLQKIPLFQGIGPEEFISLLKYIEERNFAKGSWAFREGEKSSCLYIVMKGKGEIVKKTEFSDYYERLSVAEAGEVFGEIAYLENTERTASFRILEPATILVFFLEKLRFDEKMKHVYEKIEHNLALYLAKKLKQADSLLLERFMQRVNHIQTESRIKNVFFYLFVVSAIYFNLLNLLKIYFSERTISQFIAIPLWSLVFLSGIIWILRKLDYNREFYGLTLRDCKKQIVEAVLYSIPIILFFVCVKWILIQFYPKFESLPLFYFESENWKLVVAYLIFIPIEEFVVRGLLQSVFRSFMQNKAQIFVPIICSNLFYEFVQGLRNYWYGLTIFAVGIMWGYLYEKHRSLVGVVVSHALIGGILLFPLDFLKIFDLLTEAINK